MTKQPNAPINVFIHGGAWRSGNAKVAAYMSETFVDAGAHFISLDFNNVTEVERQSDDHGGASAARHRLGS